jgi:hypothetical protein
VRSTGITRKARVEVLCNTLTGTPIDDDNPFPIRTVGVQTEWCPNEEGLASLACQAPPSVANGGDSLRTVLFNLMLQRFNSAAVAERITDRIIEEANNGEQHVRDYLLRNLEFTKPTSDEIAEILFRYKCALGSPETTAQRRSDPV